MKKNIASLKQQAAADYAATKRDVEKKIKDLQADIQRVDERFTAWDSARERQLNARLDQADARLEVWKAQADQKRADQAMKRHDDLAALEEKIALARARAAAEKNEKYSAKARAALEESEQHFVQATTPRSSATGQCERVSVARPSPGDAGPDQIREEKRVMAELIAVGFQGTHRAAEVLDQLQQLNAGLTLDLKDGVAVYRAHDGKLRIDRSVYLTTKEETAWGSVLGALVGAVLALPVAAFASVPAAVAALGIGPVKRFESRTRHCLTPPLS